jgi:hypothetical protein
VSANLRYIPRLMASSKAHFATGNPRKHSVSLREQGTQCSIFRLRPLHQNRPWGNFKLLLAPAPSPPHAILRVPPRMELWRRPCPVRLCLLFLSHRQWLLPCWAPPLLLLPRLFLWAPPLLTSPVELLPLLRCRCWYQMYTILFAPASFLSSGAIFVVKKNRGCTPIRFRRCLSRALSLAVQVSK